VQTWRRNAGSGQKRVVVVDDSPVFRRVLCELLERRGYTIVGEASCASQAIDHVARLRPDAVLVDVHLPDQSGFELAARLTDEHSRLAVLLMSAAFRHDFYALAQVSGARGFVPKSELPKADLAQFCGGRAREPDRHTVRGAIGVSANTAGARQVR
jgi:DNA-binding NarL/FixJ family response regulator